MGWLNRIFGKEEEEKAKKAPKGVPVYESKQSSKPTPSAVPSSAPSEDNIPPERIGIDGKYDQSGLAKRVVLAFDEDPNTDDIETIWVAQTGTTVVLKGKAPSQGDLDKLVSIAKGVYGCGDVDTEQVEIS